ncbi:hypothetical protein V2J09_007176 [Rumex salicifolius]
METELKDLPNPQNSNNHLRCNTVNGGESPLLKSDYHEQSRSPDFPSSPSSAVPVTAEELEEMEKKCAAYVRHDVYGPMGRGPLPLTEKLLLGLALLTLVPIRVVLAMVVLVVYYLICRVCTLFAPIREGEQRENYAHLVGWRREVIVRCGRFLSRMMLFAFGFYWIQENNVERMTKEEVEGNDQSKESERPGAIVSNHVSYLDILYHMSSSFPSFVAKKSVSKLPLVGLISFTKSNIPVLYSKCLGCVYVQREYKSSDFLGVSGVVTERVREAHEDKQAPFMMLFPEGTTTNGNFLLPFKTGAFLARVPVLPVILKYPYRRFSPAWDSMAGARHVILLLCQFANYIEVTRLPVYYPSKEEKNDPKLYADNVRRLMAREGNLELSDIGLAEKRVYHTALNGINSPPTVLHPKAD